MNKRDKIILNKIVNEASALEQILYNIDENTFLNNDEKMRAACMTLINIGELIKHLNENFREKHCQIPWKAMAGFRDVAAHGYFTLRMTDVWIYATVELPIHKMQINMILNSEKEDD
jgi:uncharacterized protein with HEPN domain